MPNLIPLSNLLSHASHIRVMFIFTARVRSTREGNIFSLLVSPRRGEVLQSLVLGPFQGEGAPQTLVPGPFWGVPPSPVTGPVQSPVPGSAGGGGRVPAGTGQGYPFGHDRRYPQTAQGYPPDRIGATPRQDRGYSPRQESE